MILQLSHELRTPLTAVRGYTELALRLDPEGSGGQRRQFIKNALDQLGTLTRMIDQVIDVSQAITGNLALDSHEFDLKELITDVVEAQYPFIEAQQLTLKLSANGIGRNEKLIVEGDPMRIASVLEHVLRNAYSYTLPGGRIEIRLSTQGPKVVIKVEDSGVGIAQDEIDRVFDRLYRGRSAEAGPTDTRGLGLGLYLSKEIIDAHGGAIHLESKVDVGTVVTIELPKSPRG
jgi:signal transduction histidine kinase